MNEGHLEAGVMGQQTSVENVVALAPNEIVEKQVWAGEDVVEAYEVDVDRIEMVLERIILMIEEPKIVVIVIVLLEQKNENEDVEPHAHILVVHLRKRSIHDLAVTGTIEVLGLSRLKPFTLGSSRFEGRHQLTKVGPSHLEEYF